MPGERLCTAISALSHSYMVSHEAGAVVSKPVQKAGRSSSAFARSDGDAARDRGHVAKVGAAAAAEDVEPGQPRLDLGVLARELVRIALVEGRRGVELRVALAAGVAAQAAEAAGPGRIGELAREVVGVGAVDHEVSHRIVARGIDLADRLGEALAGG